MSISPVRRRSLLRPSTLGRLFWRAILAWWADSAMRLGASLAYYTLFALAPILLIVIAVAGSIFGVDAVRGEVVGQIDDLVGTEGARTVQALLESAWRERATALAATIGVVTLIMAACGAFLELQAAFNTIWRVKPTPESKVKAFVAARVQSFGLVVSFGFLLLVSLTVSATLAALGQWMGSAAGIWPMVVSIAHAVTSFVVITVLFALLFKLLPDVKLHWHDVFAGAVVTTVLFWVGKHLIGLYLGRSATVSAYGAAGSVILLLLWVYYSSQIVLIGAEFTRLYAEERRGPVQPETFATRTPEPTPDSGR